MVFCPTDFFLQAATPFWRGASMPLQKFPRSIPEGLVLLWRETSQDPFFCQWPGCGRSFGFKHGAQQHGRSHQRATGSAKGHRLHTGFRPLDEDEGKADYVRELDRRRKRAKRAMAKAEKELGRAGQATTAQQDRGFPRALAELITPPSSSATGAVRRGCEFALVSHTESGSGELMVYGHGQGDSLLGALKSALCWAKLHRAGLRDLFAERLAVGDEPPRLLVDLGRRDYDLQVDLGYYEISKTGSSLGLAAACSLVRLMTGVGVERCVAMTGSVSPSGLVTEIGHLEGKMRWVAEADDIEVLVLPHANLQEAQGIVAQHGWSQRLRLLPVGDMEEVVRLLFLQSVRGVADPPVLPAQPRALEADFRRLAVVKGFVPVWRELELPVFECALLPGRGRVVCTGMGADSTPVLVEEANKTVSIAKALCKRVLAGRLVHDLSDSEKWDVHLHFRPGDSRITGDVGLSMLAGLLALAMGRPLDEDTTAYWGGLVAGGAVSCVGNIKKAHVVGFVQAGGRRLLLCPVAQRVVEQLRQEALQEQEMDEELRAGLEALQLVAVPAKVTDASVTDLLQAIWPPASV